MPLTLVDAFTPDTFNTISLTAAIQKAPHAPTLIRQLGIFRDIPIASKTALIEEERGVLTLIPTTARGSVGVPMRQAKRVATPVNVPHIEVTDTIMADDIIGVRAFGGAEAVTRDDVVARRMASMRASIDVTNEYLRMCAIQGKIYYPTDGVLTSFDAALDLYTLFGLTNVATNQQKVNFVWATQTTKIAADIIPTIHDKMMDALGGTPYTDIVALCGRTFFRALIGQATVIAAYTQQQALWNLQPVGVVSDAGQRRMSFRLGDVTFIEYYGKIGTAAGAGADGLFQAADTAYAIPMGVDIFHTYYAPADIQEAVGTLGEQVYAYSPVEMQTAKQLGLAAQSNPLNLCIRPRAIIRLVGA